MKLPDYKGNAVYAKVRCIYGRRLTNRNYNDLLGLHSVNEVAEYLKTKTAYSEIFDGISSTSALQRGQLENLLFNKMYNELEAISRFQRAAGNSLYEYFIMKYDIVQLIKVLSSLRTKSDSYIFSFPVFYNERSKLDLYEVAKTKSEEELLSVTKNTIYYPVLKSAVSKYKLTGNLTAVQIEFKHFLDEQLALILFGKKKKIPKKDDFAALYKTFNDVNTFKNLHRIMRFSVSPVVAQGAVRPVFTALSEKQRRELRASGSASQVETFVENSCYRDIIKKGTKSDFSACADEYLFKIFKNAVSHSSNPDIVMFSYVYLAENEIKNIIHIIEGIRYGLTPVEITPLLCGVSVNK